MALLVERAHALDFPLYQWACDAYRAQIALWQGNHELASSLLARLRSQLTGADLIEPLWQVLALTVELNIAVGNRETATEAAEQLRRVVSSSPRPSIERAVDLATATLESDRGAALHALETATGDGARLDEARAHFVLGALGEDPETHLNRAMSLYEQMNALVWTRRVSSSAKQLGVRLPRDHRPDVRAVSSTEAKLTVTDRDLIRLVSQGLSNRQISDLLHYSPKTIEIYLSRLYRKVGVSSRFELIAAAQRGQIGEDLRLQ